MLHESSAQDTKSPAPSSAAQAAADEKLSAQAWAVGAFLGKAVPHAPKSLLDASRPPFSFTYGGKANPVADQSQTAGLSLYVPQHAAGAWAFDPYSFRSVATMGASLCPDIRNKDLPVDAVKLALGEVKELRPLYFGDYYPLFAINDSEQAWCGWQFDRPELGRGFGMVFRRAKAANASADVALRGLDPQAKYEVEFRDSYVAIEQRN